LPIIGKQGIVKYVLLGLCSGLSSFLFINTVNRVIANTISGKLTGISYEYTILFAFIILFYIWSRRTLALIVINVSQRVAWQLRKEILSLVLHANYQQLTSRKEKIQSAILNDVGALTNASLATIDFFIGVIMAVSCLSYLASISGILFFITLGTALAGVSIYVLSSKRNLKGFGTARTLENKFQENFNAILNGFKEIFMEPRKGKHINEKNIDVIATESFRNNVSALTGFINSAITGQIFFYILISSVLLYFGTILNIGAANTVAFVFTLLYLLGSIETVMNLFPTLMRAKIASDHLIDLKTELEEANFKNPIPEKHVLKHIFERITVSDLEFYYGNEESSFGVGPIDFEVQQGQLIFIYGGNGSGKTTFVHSVIGLSIATSGQIRVNDILINDENYPDYRSLFAVVFSDFYLFNEIIGVESFDAEKLKFYLKLFEIDGKVTVEGRRFSTTDLSTGQRKRLALVAALLEDKPILVLDEWAADQDPYFRKKFYIEILPLLKKRGITVIAITHDDKYYHCADRLYKMDEGRITEEDYMIHQPGLATML
jgi:cyclic peptide transporter